MGPDIGGYLSAGSGLGVTVTLMYLFWKFNRSTDLIYTRRANDQVVTISDLEAHLKNYRREIEECHAERLRMSREFHIENIKQSTKISELTSLVENLEHKIDILSGKI